MSSLAISIPSGIPTSWAIDKFFKVVRNNRAEVYRPLFENLDQLCKSLTSLEFDLHWKWREFNDSDVRVLDNNLRNELEEIDVLLDKYAEEWDKLVSSLRDTFESKDLDTEQNLPPKLTEKDNSLTRFVTEKTSRTGKITPEKYIHDVDWILLFGPFLIEYGFLDGFGSRDEFKEQLEEYIDSHGLDEEVVKSEGAGQLGLARNWWKRWSAWEQNWHEHLLDSKSNPEPGLWDVISEHEQQFKEVERLRNEICMKSNDSMSKLKPKTYPLHIQAKRLGSKVVSRIRDYSAGRPSEETEEPGQSDRATEKDKSREEDKTEEESETNRHEKNQRESERERLTE